LEVILDTNALSDLAEGNSIVRERLRSARTHSLPTIVLGEFRYGLERSRAKVELQQWLAKIEREMEILDISRETAHFYAQVKNDLRSIGRPIPENDVWIAALAVQHGLAILTRDSHFGYVNGIVCVGW